MGTPSARRAALRGRQVAEFGKRSSAGRVLLQEHMEGDSAATGQLGGGAGLESPDVVAGAARAAFTLHVSVVPYTTQG